MKKVLLSLIIISFSSLLFAQSNYNEAIQQGDDAVERTEYTKAIRSYLIAREFAETRELQKTAQDKLNALYSAIDSAFADKKITEGVLKELKRELEQTEQELEKLKRKQSSNTNSGTQGIATNPPPKPPLFWSDFSLLYEKPADQWYVSIGYGMNMINNVTYKDDTVKKGHCIGVNVGSRHGIINNMGFGYQAGIGLGFNGDDTYLHWTFGGKFYPWNCIFISANYGAASMIKYDKEPQLNITDGNFTYYEEHSKKYYNGFSLLAGADYCFGNNTTDKLGGIVNIAAGTVLVEGKWGITFNVGIGLVFGKQFK